MFEHINRMQRYIYIVLAVMLLIVIIISVFELIELLVLNLIGDASYLRLDTMGILDFFEYFLLILIGIELLESIKSFIIDNTIHIDIILILAIIAVARKVIVIDYAQNDPFLLMGTAALVFALCAGYFLVKKADMGKKTIET